MKKLVVLGLMVFSLTACDSYDGNKCYESVRKAYPDAKVHLLPSEKFRFIVETKQGEVIYVETMDVWSTDITQTYVIIEKE